MKNRILATVALATSMMTTAAYAQSSLEVRADIPFQFRIGGRLLPAGTYTVKSLSQDTVLVRSLDWSQAAMAITNPVQANGTPAEGKLVFQRYGDAYFLSEVWHPGSEAGIQVRKSKAEREMARHGQPPTLASIALSNH